MISQDKHPVTKNVNQERIHWQEPPNASSVNLVLLELPVRLNVVTVITVKQVTLNVDNVYLEPTVTRPQLLRVNFAPLENLGIRQVHQVKKGA